MNDLIDTQRAQFLLEQIESQGFTAAQLAALAASGHLERGMTVAKAAGELPGLFTKDATLATYQPYINFLTTGYPGLCTCMCPRCLERMTYRGHTPCPCVSAGTSARNHCVGDGPVLEQLVEAIVVIATILLLSESPAARL